MNLVLLTFICLFFISIESTIINNLEEGLKICSEKDIKVGPFSVRSSPMFANPYTPLPLRCSTKDVLAFHSLSTKDRQDIAIKSGIDGTVYRWKRPSDNALLAVKKIDAESPTWTVPSTFAASEPIFKANPLFIIEVQTLQTVKGDGIAPDVECIFSENPTSTSTSELYYMMTWLPGETLDEVKIFYHPWLFDLNQRWAEICFHMAALLDRLHSYHRIVHLDPHRDNWFFDSATGHLSLIDFSRARSLLPAPLAKSPLFPCSCPAPELWDDKTETQYSPKTDVYMLRSTFSSLYSSMVDYLNYAKYFYPKDPRILKAIYNMEKTSPQPILDAMSIHDPKKRISMKELMEQLRQFGGF